MCILHHPTLHYVYIVSYRKRMDSSTVTWGQLREEISKAFSTENVDVDHVKALLSAYKSNKEDWGKFAYFDKYK